MIVQTVKIEGTKIVANGADFNDLRWQRADDKSMTLELTDKAFGLLKEAFAKGESSVSTAGKSVAAKAPEAEAEVQDKEGEAASEEADPKEPAGKAANKGNKGNKGKVKK